MRVSSPGCARSRSSGWSARRMHQADERVPVTELRELARMRIAAVLASVRCMNGQLRGGLPTRQHAAWDAADRRAAGRTGWASFGDTPRAFLASLAPCIGIPWSARC